MGLHCLRWAVLPAHRLMRTAPWEKFEASVGQGSGVSDVVCRRSLEMSGVAQSTDVRF